MNKPGLGSGIETGMALTRFPSNDWWDETQTQDLTIISLGHNPLDRTFVPAHVATLFIIENSTKYIVLKMHFDSKIMNAFKEVNNFGKKRRGMRKWMNRPPSLFVVIFICNLRLVSPSSATCHPFENYSWTFFFVKCNALFET